jgi:hypothetical protein
MEDDQDEQGGSLPLSPMCLTSVLKDVMGQPQTTQKINNQQSKSKGGTEDGRSVAVASGGQR